MDITKEELESARRRWEEAEITNYNVTLYYQGGWVTYEMQLEIHKDQPKLLWIQFPGGKRYSTNASLPGTPITKSDEFQLYRYTDFTVNKQFDLFEQELTTYDPTQTVTNCHVEFDQVAGYPSLRRCDIREMSDDDYTLRISDLTKLEP
ncbi:MAG: DUF6174 domain-containing protein [Chloroflexia bacterium]